MSPREKERPFFTAAMTVAESEKIEYPVAVSAALYRQKNARNFPQHLIGRRLGELKLRDYVVLTDVPLGHRGKHTPRCLSA